MAVPPVITNALTSGANSTVQTGQTPAQGLYQPTDPTRVALYGGPLLSGRFQTLTRTAGSRVGGHGSCMAFWTEADTVDFSLRTNTSSWMAIVTDPAGVRARISASDQVPTWSDGNYNYYKLAFGSTAGGGRMVEVYVANAANIGGINVPNGYSIWPAYLPQQTRFGVLWDSWGEGSMNSSTLNLKLAVADWIGAVLGVNNPYVCAVGGTGVLATNGGVYLNYQQRLDAGDMDASRIGDLDLIYAPPSINDSSASAGGLTRPAGDAAGGAAYQTLMQTLMVRQPNAIIVGGSQQMSSTAAALASSTAAYKAALLAAAATAGGGRRVQWSDGVLFESAPDTGVIGGDAVHVAGVYGASHCGQRIGRQILATVATI